MTATLSEYCDKNGYYDSDSFEYRCRICKFVSKDDEGANTLTIHLAQHFAVAEFRESLLKKVESDPEFRIPERIKLEKMLES
jgi:hypothetical protein